MTGQISGSGPTVMSWTEMKQINEGPYKGLERTGKKIPAHLIDDSEWKCGFPGCDGSCFVPSRDVSDLS